MTPTRTLALGCVHIPQLMTHPAIETTLLTLQLYYKPLGILQRVTNSQQVHISSHDGFFCLFFLFVFFCFRPQTFFSGKFSPETQNG